MELHELTAAEAAGRIRSGDLSAADYAKALDRRREAVEPRLQALAWYDPDRFLAAAARSDDALRSARKSGAGIPPLAGIPLGVKDNMDTAGVPTRSGSRLYENNVPSADAAILGPLYGAGALLFGKTVTPELAFIDAGSTRNPWNTAHTPGGSSSGSAAGVAAGLFPLALGTQTAGSVIRPAAYCGVAAFLPTRGSLPLDGILPFSPTLDQPGLFARCVGDLALAFSALTGSGWPVEPLDRKPFLGLARRYFIETAEDEMGRMVVHAAKKLASGAAVIHVAHLPESFADVHRCHRLIMAVELARLHRERFLSDRGSYGEKVSALIEEGLAVPEWGYKKALVHQKLFRDEMAMHAGEVDAILAPAVPAAAPYGVESTGDPRFNIPWTNAGLPVITLPGGLSVAGLPMGIQLVGAPGTDLHLLRVALRVEESLDWGRRIAPAA